MARNLTPENWWALRLSRGVADGDQTRRSRGRAYFFGGAVRRLTVDSDRRRVTAQVQGSRGRPYRVMIGGLSDAGWGGALGELGRIPGARAALLDGLMPEDVEDVFARHGARLFPDSVDDLAITCSCPDYGGHPCKHGAAVLFALAGWSDHEPLVLFAWSGWDEEAVLDALGSAGVGSSGELSVEVEPLAARATDFWERGAAVPDPVRPRPFDPLAHWEGATTGIASRLAPMYAALARPGDVDTGEALPHVPPGAGE
ncbi:SWIM zinc finger family protein [Nocardiopsis alkaliphila]|mgnify:CR=1 FL=1|uniref:SWIM zinc finger family protein n=1 Tax=Nocardiopsis alkaliphila TaxID=225762 RepID=UPI00034BBAA2|nr:SWIM zinc finger family protein [Nocardiopsis alkaliphila]